MTSFRLPDSLGGHPVELVSGAIRRDGELWLSATGTVAVKVPDVGVMAVPRAALIEVAQEPPDGTLMLYRHPEVSIVYQRDDKRAAEGQEVEGWKWHPDGCTLDRRWWGTGHDSPYAWSTLKGMNGEWVRLVPDPAADAPPLRAALDRAIDTLAAILDGAWESGHPGYPAQRTHWCRAERLAEWQRTLDDLRAAQQAEGGQP